MSIRTDLALEAADNFEKALPDGVLRHEFEESGFTVTEIEITNKNGEKAVGKPQGRYVTIHSSGLSANSDKFAERIEVLAKQIRRLCKERNAALVIGLGNKNITPDSLGSKTAEHILATRHIKRLSLDFDTSSLGDICVLAPGVLGQTGIEAAEVAKSVCDRVKPQIVIAIDALACSELSNLGTTIQLSDTGICPGSGVENARRELSEKTLGVPCIAIGVPTVVDMATIAEHMTGVSVHKQDIKSDMMVTPRSIDSLMDKTAKLIAMAINRALMPEMSIEEISFLC